MFSKMRPMVLYRSLNPIFPFCDLVYKEVIGSEERLVCVQVSLEASGSRIVTRGAFQPFCKRMGWGGEDSPTQEQVSLIHYVYCPIPAVADQATVTFEDGININGYTVWHVSPNFEATDKSNPTLQETQNE